MRLVGAAALATLVVFALALYARQISRLPPLSPADLVRFEFDAYSVGFAVLELAVPVVFIYILGTTNLFRRIVSGQAAPRDALKLFGLLVVIQLLTLSYLSALSFLTDEQITFGVLIVVAGSLLGGWRLGLGLGLVTMFVHGTQDLILYPGDDDLLVLYRSEGLPGFFDLALWSDLFIWRYLVEMEVSSAVWAGIVAGLGAEVLGQRRFAPGTALGLAVGIDLGVGYLTSTSWEDPAVLISFLIPSVAASGSAMAAIALIVRSVQAEAVRRKAEAAELALARAELRALRAQINPHFLFNVLNTIRYFVRADPMAARRLLLNLSEVFQHALRAGEFVPLQDELNYVEAYLALEKNRLGERLQVEWSIQGQVGTAHPDLPGGTGDSLLLDHPVPTLILQPIVENAVIHGIARKAEPGTVSITAEKVDEDLVLRVEDDGPGIAPARLAEILYPTQPSNAMNLPAQASAAEGSKREASIGLRNVDGRLRALYGEAYRLVVETQVGRGTCVQIRIPIER